MALIRPPVKSVWADTGDKVEPLAAEVLSGWPNSSTPPSRQRFNWILNFLSNGVRYLSRRGISDWDAAETYAIGDVVLATDGDHYKAIAINTNQAPQSNPSSWVGFGGSLNNVTGFTTGDGKFTMNPAPQAGWVSANDGTIGDATSGATTRANADTINLYSMIWNNVADQWAPVVGGRGLTALADFNAHKPIALTKQLGRALIIAGAGTTKISGVDADVDITNDWFVIPSQNSQVVTGMPFQFILASGTVTGLTSGNIYYAYRHSATQVKWCTSLANAQNGVVIDITAKSSPVWSFTHSYLSHALGEHGGSQTHPQTVEELVSHVHPLNAGAQGGGGAQGGSVGGTASGFAGGNKAMDIMQPYSAWHCHIKL